MTVDNLGRIIVVESKNGNVVIFDLMGKLLKIFNCSQLLSVPTGVAVSKNSEKLYIVDYRLHCVKVFDNHGNHLMNIGGKGITRCPVDVFVSESGNVVTACNSLKNFSLSVFDESGRLLNTFNSEPKYNHYGMALLADGSFLVIDSSRNIGVAISRYVKVILTFLYHFLLLFNGRNREHWDNLGNNNSVMKLIWDFCFSSSCILLYICLLMLVVFRYF